MKTKGIPGMVILKKVGSLYAFSACCILTIQENKLKSQEEMGITFMKSIRSPDADEIGRGLW